MSHSQSQRPRGLISRLSSRNRRRRRESRREKVPIPSFSFGPSQKKSDQNNHHPNNAADIIAERPLKVTEIEGRVRTEKENITSQSNNIFSGSEESKKDFNIQSTQVGTTTDGVHLNKVPIAASIINHHALGKHGEFQAGSTISNHARGRSTSTESTDSFKKSAIDCATITNCNDNLAGDNLDLSKDISAKDTLTSPKDALINAAEEKATLVDNALYYPPGRANDSRRNSKKRKFESDVAPCANSPQLDITTKEVIDNSSNNYMVSCSNVFNSMNTPISNVEIGGTRNAKDVLTHNNDFNQRTGATHDIASFSDVEIIPGSTSEPMKPKSTCNFISAKPQPASKAVKKKSNVHKKTVVTKQPREVIHLDSDSDSSSSSDQNWAFRRRVKKQSESKRSVVKAKKGSKSKTKNLTTHSKKMSTRNGTKNTFSDGKNICSACSTCKCKLRDGTSATPSKVSTSLSDSLERQERVLINRLQKIERNVRWMECQKLDVGRQLIKHRKVMTKKWEENNPSNLADKPKFLADIDEQGGFESNVELTAEEVGQASVLIFGETKGTYVYDLMPSSSQALMFIFLFLAKTVPKSTLTQHFGSSSERTKSVGSVFSQDASNIESNHRLDLSPIHEERKIDEEKLQRRSAAAHLTSMADLTHTIIYSQETNRVSSWEAATTAPTVASKLDEMLTSPCSKSSVGSTRTDNGLDELLQLFAHTQYKSDLCPESLLGIAADRKEHSQSMPLSPRGNQVADSIEQSIINDSTKLASIERTCPEWRDNIRYAQLQTDPDELGSALQSVKKAKSKVNQIRERVLQALMDRESTLEMFEQSLKRSIDRLKE